jgi:hypothetical protein
LPIVDTDGTVKLFPGIKEKDVKALLKPFESRKIIHFKSMPGGAASFGGFDLEETWKVFQEDMMRIPAMWCCIDAHEAQQRGQPFPPGQTWYDLLHDIIPHQDKFGRTWTDKWSIKLGEGAFIHQLKFSLFLSRCRRRQSLLFVSRWRSIRRNSCLSTCRVIASCEC